MLWNITSLVVGIYSMFSKEQVNGVWNILLHINNKANERPEKPYCLAGQAANILHFYWFENIYRLAYANI